MLNLEDNDRHYNVKKHEGVELKDKIPTDEYNKRIAIIQRFTRQALARRNMKQKLSLAAKLEQKVKAHGKLLRLNFKKIDDKYYRVRIFEKVEGEDTYYNFIISSISIHDKQRAMLSFKTSDVRLLNSHGMYLVDYLTDNLKRKSKDEGFLFYF